MFRWQALAPAIKDLTGKSRPALWISSIVRYWHWRPSRAETDRSTRRFPGLSLNQLPSGSWLHTYRTRNSRNTSLGPKCRRLTCLIPESCPRLHEVADQGWVGHFREETQPV